MKNDAENNYYGCIIGLAIGDVLGAPFEFWKKENVAEYLAINRLELFDFTRGDQKFPAGFYTDDTSQALCLAKSLIENGFDVEDQMSKYRKWLFEGYLTPLGRAYGVGQHTLRALSRKNSTNDLYDGSEIKAGGNGSLMRCPPVGLYYQGNLDEIEAKSLLSSYITHNNIIAGWSCVVLNSMISLIIDGHAKEEIPRLVANSFSDKMPGEIRDCLTADYQKIGSKYPFPISGYSLDTLRIAIWSWQTSNDYEESIMKVVLLGNDTDTFAAVTGALVGCYYGQQSIPQKWLQKLMRKDDIIEIAEHLYQKSKRDVL